MEGSVLEKLKAVLRLGALTGSTVSYESTKALIDRTLLEFQKLQERRRFLEEHMKPWYSDAQYRASLNRIEADERRLLKKLKSYFTRIDEIRPGADRRGLELKILAADGMGEDRDRSEPPKPLDRSAKTRAESEKSVRRLELLRPDDDCDDVSR